MSDQGEEAPKNGLPPYFDKLSESDKVTYMEMKKHISNLADRISRGSKQNIFLEIFNLIRRFCHRNEPNDFIRCLVCGYAFCPHYLGVNQKRSQYLLNKSKSSLHTVMRELGYELKLNRADTDKEEIYHFFPKDFDYIGSKRNELRAWTIRNYPVPVSDLPILVDDPTKKPHYNPLIPPKSIYAPILNMYHSVLTAQAQFKAAALQQKLQRPQTPPAPPSSPPQTSPPPPPPPPPPNSQNNNNTNNTNNNLPTLTTNTEPPPTPNPKAYEFTVHPRIEYLY
ncbi:hypothetical protein TVAG_344000 [Trichomonas vaginalis G3]|uniref:Initiator binding domain-containing protein n=1 Tax=Trichomonas vaginalis (strain ATCC PRA-98 / G3) TaxID=412133 RepID=A2E7M1_TRIV3|nr:transcription-initiator DNA-binding domain ibd family [Trichomonas vaginalis G3]EAY11306.1 hypothetical protein TVAG_344000 [Trichomonas vaginalis G3]KAI5523742.1 transcription-initiator DNA-binding domain ibd family [Trichomonas vaginalis G3]|eukprot:XP_001323529.1 hypothetical protein [Trichomonas vaginalis G3]